MLEDSPRRLLILASKLGYQTRSFGKAAQKLGVEVLFATDRCHQLEDPWDDHAIAVHFEQPQRAAFEIVKALNNVPVDAVLALGDTPTVAAAYTAKAFGLEHNSPAVTEACRSKLRQREILRAAGLPVPPFFAFSLGELPEIVSARAPFPCVVKPLSLSASQGVIRANTPRNFPPLSRGFAACSGRRRCKSPASRASTGCLSRDTYPGRKLPWRDCSPKASCACWRFLTSPTRSKGPFSRKQFMLPHRGCRNPSRNRLKRARKMRRARWV